MSKELSNSLIPTIRAQGTDLSWSWERRGFYVRHSIGESSGGVLGKLFEGRVHENPWGSLWSVQVDLSKEILGEFDEEPINTLSMLDRILAGERPEDVVASFMEERE